MAETFQTAALNEPQIYLHIVLITLTGFAVLYGPLLFLVAPIYRCQRTSILENNAFAHAYAMRFRQQWLAPSRPDRGELLASGEDIQSLAALEVYWRVRTMRVLPVTGRLLYAVFCCAAVPHLPLLLLKYPMADLVSDLVQKIIGL